MNKNRVYVLLFGLATFFYGCSSDKYLPEKLLRKSGTLKGYSIEIVNTPDKRRMFVTSENSSISCFDNNFDGRFDEIRLSAPKYSSLEKIMDLKTLEKMYDSVKEQRGGEKNE